MTRTGGHAQDVYSIYEHGVDKRQYSLAYIYILLRKTQTILPIKEMNRIRVVLAELNKKNKWLADKLGKNQATVSQWCNNARQPSVETLFDIAEVLNVDVRKLLVSSKDDDN